MNDRKLKQLILFLCFLHIGLLCVGQKVKNKSVTIGEKIELPGVLEVLQPSQTFVVEVPTQLSFYKKGENGLVASTVPMTKYAKLKAVEGTGAADYTFKIVTPGISIVDLVVNKRSLNGYFGEITYTFPGSLEVYNKEGKLVRQYVLSNENTMLHTSYDPAFLTASAGGVFEQKPVTGFASEKALQAAFEKEKNKVYARIEATELDRLIRIGQEIMSFGYGTYVWPYKFTFMELDKKGQETYPELTEQIQKYSQTLEAYIADPGNESYLEKFAGYGDFFAGQLNEQAPEGVVTSCAFNAICCYCMAEDLEKADALFREHRKSFGLFVAPRLDDFGYGYSARRAVRDQEEVVYYQQGLSFSGRIRAEEQAAEEMKIAAGNEARRARMEVLSRRNINKVAGYVVEKDGNKYEGKLVSEFVQGSSGIVNTSLGKHVMVYPQEGKVRGFGPAKLQYFVADGVYFFPLKKNEPAMTKAMDVFDANFGGRSFFERVYETAHYALYFDRTNAREDVFLVGKKDAGEATPFTWIRALNSNILQDLGVCDALQERIKSGEFQKEDAATMKAFVDALENCR